VEAPKLNILKESKDVQLGAINGDDELEGRTGRPALITSSTSSARLQFQDFQMEEVFLTGDWESRLADGSSVMLSKTTIMSWCIYWCAVNGQLGAVPPIGPQTAITPFFAPVMCC
jgi:hypothetical protein